MIFEQDNLKIQPKFRTLSASSFKISLILITKHQVLEWCLIKLTPNTRTGYEVSSRFLAAPASMHVNGNAMFNENNNKVFRRVFLRALQVQKYFLQALFCAMALRGARVIEKLSDFFSEKSLWVQRASFSVIWICERCESLNRKWLESFDYIFPPSRPL